jgi:hypothetical protein
VFAALLGVASFHRACLLAQDFTHEPACQTGERAPQGRFRHQPEQMVHPPFAWQVASFPSLPVCGEEAPYCPLRDFATLRTYSPEIKARQALFAFLPVYPELVGVVGSRVPDYRGRFLRGLQSGHSVGQTVANSIKSHNHSQPTHTHSFSGQLVSTALSGTAAGQRYSSTASLSVSGTAAGQRYSDDAVLWTTNYYNAADVSGGSGPIRSSNIRSNISTKTASSSTISGTAKGTVSGTAQASSVSGNLQNGTVSGTIGAGGGAPTDYTGSSETAPDHIYVRCLIRAKP